MNPIPRPGFLSPLLFLLALVLSSADRPANGEEPAAASTAAPATKPAPNTLTPEEIADGWLLLFDGESLYGWRPALDASGAKANWSVADGVISVSSGPKGLLRTTTQFSDYELSVDFRAPRETNSGIFLRTSPQPKKPDFDCYELNIAPADNPFPTGSLVGRQKTIGDHYQEGWQTFLVTCEQGRVVVRLDGQQVLDYTDPRPLGRGYIGLQHNTGAVEFRNVKLRPLRTRSLFNGQDLTGWKTYPEMESKFDVNERQHLHISNGPGQLESTDRFADFILQLECMTHGEGLNSGVFFRCIPGDRMMGYEAQIHNGYQQGDRSMPVDCGTGGLFRRKDARRVVSDDRAWFTLTLVAEGPHFSTWVNGYPVCDWTDKRPPNENPRRGLRREAGTLMLQGHDPTTDISFRNIRIGELSPRWQK